MPSQGTWEKNQLGREISQSLRNASVIEFNCDTVEDFIDTISPNGSVMSRFETHVCPCIFRGVSSSTHLLVPSALRNNISGWEEFEWVYGCDNHQGQLLWEQSLIRAFFQVADAHGLQIPEDTQQLRRTVARIATYDYVGQILSGKEQWPPDELLSLMGVAQHYGIPTRLLDWTRDPFVAAYFAASGVESGHSGPDEKLAVWILNQSALNGSTSRQGEPRRRIDNLVIVGSPSALNQRLFAQQGLFTLYRPLEIEDEFAVHHVPLDDYLERPGWPTGSQLFWLVTLPKSMAPDLLRILIKLHYTPAKIYPGFQGVAEALRQYPHADTINTQWFNVMALRHMLDR
jgi:FRG domain